MINQQDMPAATPPSSPVSTPLDAPMLDIWIELPEEISRMILLASTPTRLKVHLFHDDVGECVMTADGLAANNQAASDNDWEHLKNMLYIDSDSRRAALKVLREHGVLTHGHGILGFGPLTASSRISRALFDHFGSIVAVAPAAYWKLKHGISNNRVHFLADQNIRQIKTVALIPGPGQVRQFSYVEIKSVAPMTGRFNPSLVAVQMHNWLCEVPMDCWAFFGDQLMPNGQRAHLAIGQLEMMEMPGRLRWVQM
ncbi:unnamed protein product [Zymoseptoria tritici ST99CH_1E4]|uniref:Uncharacterized protein n=1 Tax=Zymoseptoria tritici ST99CH_1E4 TaxID=1276532 RepID=A0A2H1GQ42_ZYMTR|nr:unnamed protein product [Zymoseptoria tritici ST99CH_1E4]